MQLFRLCLGSILTSKVVCSFFLLLVQMFANHHVNDFFWFSLVTLADSDMEEGESDTSLLSS